MTECSWRQTPFRRPRPSGFHGKIAAADKPAARSLQLTLPDKTTEASLRDFYGSVFNGGAVNDQKGYDFGNQTDGYYYAG